MGDFNEEQLELLASLLRRASRAVSPAKPTEHITPGAIKAAVHAEREREAMRRPRTAREPAFATLGASSRGSYSPRGLHATLDPPPTSRLWGTPGWKVGARGPTNAPRQLAWPARHWSAGKGELVLRNHGPQPSPLWHRLHPR